MNLAGLSIKRPIFITCILVLMLAVGLLSLKGLPVDLFPNVTFPVVRVLTPYPGAGPTEVETLVSKPLEDEMSTVPGIKSLSSINREGVSIVVAEFTSKTDIKEAEQQIRDRVASARPKLPSGVKEASIRRIDPADQPIIMISVTAELPESQLFDLADQVVRPKLEQIESVGLVEVSGGRKREIRVLLDRDKLKSHELSASIVSSRIGAAGQNVPAGKTFDARQETSFRTLGEFRSLDEVGSTIVSFFGNDVPVKVRDLGRVTDGLQDESTRSYFKGKKTLLVKVYRQSGANTVAVADAVKARVAQFNSELKGSAGAPELSLVRDSSRFIRANVDDVKESIFIGIALTIVVVFFFLGSFRSTLITGLALPNSLIGAFILMAAAGFSINIMTLLALSLTVGLLIDDAIVVRENIFRHVEMGKSPVTAALEGTKEVTLAVIATTLTVIAVFGPIGFLQGVVGQFFKEFGLTICFAMAISLFDALTVAPMLSAYFAGTGHHADPRSLSGRTIGRAVRAFDRFQTWLESAYEKTIRFTLRRPFITLAGALGVFVASIIATSAVPKTFLPAQDAGEFGVTVELDPGASLDAMDKLGREVDATVRANKEVRDTVLIVGDPLSGSNIAQVFVNMVPFKERSINTSDFKERLRGQLKPFAHANPRVSDIDMSGGGMRPFNVNIMGDDLTQLEPFARQVFEKLKNHPALKDVEISYKAGKPEFQVALDTVRAERLGVSTVSVGMELRNQIEGLTPSVYREKGREYDIRVRLDEEQRDLRKFFPKTFVPNINQSLIRLSDIAKPVETTGPAEITRQDRGRYIRIAADVAPGGPGMGAAMADITRMFESELKVPPGVKYRFVGQAENFKELGINMMIAISLGILFIYLVLASLYESFVTPFTIMLVLPLAACGAFYALLVTRSSLDLFSMIGCVMLMGIATKNSILLVDYTNQLIEQGLDRAEAITRAGKARLRPILMTTVALIAGMLPVAIGLNEASRQRTSMGIAIIGGLISSTLLTLVVVPAAYSYIDRFRLWSKSRLTRLLAPRAGAAHASQSAPQATESTVASAAQSAPQLTQY